MYSTRNISGKYVFYEARSWCYRADGGNKNLTKFMLALPENQQKEINKLAVFLNLSI